jgi:hypothetical protein
MKYVRYDAPPELRLRYHFRDKFGRDIERARDYDPVTGVGHRAVPESDVLLEFFAAEGYVEIDGHTNPSQETLDALFSNGQTALNKDLQDKLVNRIEQQVTLRKGQAEVSDQSSSI